MSLNELAEFHLNTVDTNGQVAVFQLMMGALKSPPVVMVCQILLILEGAIWLLLGAWYLALQFTEARVPSTCAWIVAGLMFVNALAMLSLAWGIGRRQRAYYYSALAVILVNILLSVTDEFGLFDLIILLLNLAILLLLFAGRSQYLPSNPA